MSQFFSVDGVDLHAVKRTTLRGLGGLFIAIAPQFLDPSITYTANIHGHAYNLTGLVVVAGAAVIRFIEAWMSDTQ